MYNMIDATDKKILNILLKDANASYREIAKKAGVSLGTVMNRMKKLKESGIIKKFTVVIDYEKVGYTLGVLIDVRVSKGKLFEVEKVIAKDPHVFSVYDITGGFDIALVARFQSREELDRFIKGIQKLEYVQRTNTKLILNWMKEESPPFPLGMK